MGDVDPISTLLITGALIATTGFIGLYATNSPWWTSRLGRPMMTLACSVFLLCAVGLLFNVLGADYRYRPLIRDVAYLALNISMWWQLVILVKVQNASARSLEVIPDQTQDKDPVP